MVRVLRDRACAGTPAVPCWPVFLNGAVAETGCHVKDADFYLMFNSGRDSRRFVLPRLSKGAKWGRALDTALEGDNSIIAPGGKAKPLEDQEGYELAGHTCGLLIALKRNIIFISRL